MEVKGPKGIAGFILLVVIIALAYNQSQKRQEMKSWPSTEGTITYSYIDDWKRTDNTELNDIKIKKDVVEYALKVEYEFEVDGIGYTGHKLGVASNWTRSLKSVEAQLDMYPAGKQVTVYYDPDNPRDNALIR
ncbi:hypothetical protein BTA51_01155 [Hahella sp. CCB-MM4]|uniref:DUF3592 domain-containing protein n=1 Tax=Hahella sp. (strain CCB-MM4) TaxID=1926491 RepID=UPI000B9BC20F|nr:DUF3592 domain-containing protein [Hahella sp. CCB-MM4]OZG75039.1 hypothetical protein BTA51_01155 [Hahella sp. CCB-MM4]